VFRPLQAGGCALIEIAQDQSDLQSALDNRHHNVNGDQQQDQHHGEADEPAQQLQRPHHERGRYGEERQCLKGMWHAKLLEFAAQPKLEFGQNSRNRDAELAEEVKQRIDGGSQISHSGFLEEELTRLSRIEKPLMEDVVSKT
jgi:hypothetical protein